MSWSALCSIALRGCTKNILTAPVAHNCIKHVTISRYTRRSILRWLSTKQVLPPKSIPKDKSKLSSKDGFITIYKFPLIGPLSFINKVKRFHMKVLPVVVPITFALTMAGIISLDTSVMVCVVGAAVGIKFYLLGLLATNFVGFVYASPDMSTVQIAYADHSGKRQEDIFPAADLVPLSELPAQPFQNYYCTLHRYSQPTSNSLYKLNLSHGSITDMDRFTAIFGKVD